MEEYEIDEWIDKYEALSNEDRYEFIKGTFQSEVPKELIDETDMGEALIVLKDYLVSRDKIEDFIELLNIVKFSNPDFYEEMAPYLFSEVISYYLLKNNLERVEFYLQPFIKNPIAGIYSFIYIFKRIVYYGHSKLAFKIAEKCWKPVADSPEIIGGAHEFVEVIYYSLWEDIFSSLKAGNDFDVHEALKDFEKYGFEIAIDEANEIAEWLKPHNAEITVNFSTDKERIESIKRLRGAFINYASLKKNMNFIVAALIFDSIISYWEGRELHNKDKKEPEKYFSIIIEQFDDFLEDTYSGFLFEDITGESGLLWGMPYIYEFLQSSGIISMSLLENVENQIDTLKSGFKERLEPMLWECSFVHRWTKPDYISEEAFREEAECFEESLHIIAEEQDNELDLFGYDDEEYDEEDDFFYNDFLKEIKVPSKIVDKKKEKSKRKADKQQKRKNRK